MQQKKKKKKKKNKYSKRFSAEIPPTHHKSAQIVQMQAAPEKKATSFVPSCMNSV